MVGLTNGAAPMNDDQMDQLSELYLAGSFDLASALLTEIKEEIEYDIRTDERAGSRRQFTDSHANTVLPENVFDFTAWLAANQP